MAEFYILQDMLPMFAVKRYKLIAISLLAALSLAPLPAYVQEKTPDNKATNNSWDFGESFQIYGKTIPVAEDGVHDPTNDAVKVLQEPADAMQGFPRDKAGIVDWVQALDRGLIDPRKGLLGDDEMHAVDFDVIFKNTGSMPYVRYPHRPHTEWLTCKNCHPRIFLPQKGGNPVTMSSIIQGNYCGVCHGKVAFPPTKNCGRCHSVSRDSVGLR